MDPSSMGDTMNQWEIQSYQRDQGAKNPRVFAVGWSWVMTDVPMGHITQP